MESNQISVSLSLDKDVDKNTAYKTANEVTNAILKVKELIKLGQWMEMPLQLQA